MHCFSDIVMCCGLSMMYGAVFLFTILILAFLRLKKLEKGKAIPEYIPLHEQNIQVEVVFVAEVLFVIVAHHPRLHPRFESNT